MTDTLTRPGRIGERPGSSGRGLRVRPQRPVRAVLALLLVVASVVAALTVYTRIGDRTDVLVASRTILAGDRLTDADFRVVSLSTDGDLAVTDAAGRDLLVGQYAKVRIEEGSIVSPGAIQPEALVSADRVLMSVLVPAGDVPRGLREQSRVALVVDPGDGSTPQLVEATVAAVPPDLPTVLADTAGVRSAAVALSVEVAPGYVALVGSADEVSVGVLDPSAPFPGEQAQLGEAP